MSSDQKTDCPQCQWTGNLGGMMKTPFDEGYLFECPRCFYQGPLEDFRSDQKEVVCK